MNAPAEKSVCRLLVEGELNIQNAVATRERLLIALGGNDEVEMNLAGVSEFDSAGLQLLVAAKKLAAAAGKVLRFTGTAQPIVEVLEFLGLKDELAGRPESGDAP